VFDATLNDKKDKCEKMFSSLNIVLKPDEKVRSRAGQLCCEGGALRLVPRTVDL